MQDANLWAATQRQVCVRVVAPWRVLVPLQVGVASLTECFYLYLTPCEPKRFWRLALRASLCFAQHSRSNFACLAKCFAWLYSLRCRSAAHTSDVVLPLAVSKAPWSNRRTVHLCKHRFACAWLSAPSHTLCAAVQREKILSSPHNAKRQPLRTAVFDGESEPYSLRAAKAKLLALRALLRLRRNARGATFAASLNASLGYTP